MTFTDGYLTVVPGYLMVLPAVPIAVWILRRGSDPRWTLLALAALGHITAVVALTMFPIPIAGQEFYRQTRGLSGDNLVPFATISSQLENLTWNTVRQLVGNMLALAPLGIYGPKLWPALQDWRRLLVVAVAAGVSIETAQFVGSVLEGFSYRITDVDDAIMNATGAMVAFAIWRWVETRWPARVATVAAAVESLAWREKP
jgi:glycopeptide antibiotics resistance protein